MADLLYKKKKSTDFPNFFVNCVFNFRFHVKRTHSRGVNVRTLVVCSPGAADHRQADPDDEAGGEGALRRGVDGPLAGREGRRQGLLHHRGGELVQGDGDLPDLPHEARQHPGYVPVYTGLYWFILVHTGPY